MLECLVLSVTKARGAVMGLLVLLIGAGVYAGATLSIDAMPDVSPVQVTVLTPTCGLSAEEGTEHCQHPHR